MAPLHLSYKRFPLRARAIEGHFDLSAPGFTIHGISPSAIFLIDVKVQKRAAL